MTDRIRRLFYANVLIGAASLVELYFLGRVSPWEYIGMTGIAWVLISSFESIRTLRRLDK